MDAATVPSNQVEICRPRDLRVDFPVIILCWLTQYSVSEVFVNSYPNRMSLTVAVL